MKQHTVSIEMFHTSLKKWIGKDIRITKYENKDHDVTSLHLETVSYLKNEQRKDDYEPKYALLLGGQGQVLTDNKTFIQLPDDVYEIPLDDLSEYTIDGPRFSLKTDRGVYTIENKDQ